MKQLILIISYYDVIQGCKLTHLSKMNTAVSLHDSCSQHHFEGHRYIIKI